MDIKELKETIKGLSGEEAVKVLSDYIETHGGTSDLDEAYTLRGMKYWGMQKRAAAINDYLSAIRLNPESKARHALQATNEIMDYYNTDLYNP